MAIKRTYERPVSAAAIERRTEIARTAASLFAEHGYSTVTMDDIAHEVGLAKPTLYHYFKSKEELLFSIHEELFEFLTGRVDARADMHLPPAEELREVLVDIFDLIDARRGHAQAFFEYSKHLDDAYKSRIQDQRDRYDSVVTSIFARGIAAGAFRPVDPRTASLGFFGMANWAYQWYVPGGPSGHTELATAFFDLIYKGLEPRGD